MSDDEEEFEDSETKIGAISPVLKVMEKTWGEYGRKDKGRKTIS